MKLDYKTVLLASSLLLGGYALAVAQEEKIPLPQVEANETKEKPVSPSHVMAVVDGKQITAGELDEWARFLVSGPEEEVTARRLMALRVLVELQAFTKAAEAQKLDKTPDFDQRMHLMRESVLRELYAGKNLKGPLEKDLKARYDKEVSALSKEEEVRARHIVVDSKEKAQDIIRRLEKGEDFEKLAKENSIDTTTASFGGDLDYFTKGQMVKELEDTAFALKVGEYSKTPVKTEYGWDVIKVEDKRMKEPPTFEEAKMSLYNQLMNENARAMQQQVISELKVTYPDKSVAKAMQKLTEDTENADDFD